MASYVEYKGYAEAVAALRNIQNIHKSKEFRGFVVKTKDILDKDWKKRVVAGTTGRGTKVPGAAGIQLRRKGKYLGKKGAPGTPFGPSSRLASKYRSGVIISGLGFRYTGAVVGVKFAKYLVGRYRYAGLTPDVIGQIKKELDRAVWLIVRKNGGRSK